MTQQSDKASWSIKPWGGTLAQITQAAELCAEEIAAATPYPPGYGDGKQQAYDAEKEVLRREADRAREVEILIVEREGFQRSLTDIADLAGWPVNDDLRRIERIDIDVGGAGYLPVSASIGLLPGGLEIQVCGKDRIWTAGLRYRLQAILEPRARVCPRGFEGGVHLELLMLGGWGVGVLAIALLAHALKVSFGLGYLLAAGIPSAAVGFIALVRWRLPGMELLAEGAQPSYQRWKTRIVSGGVALVIGVIASIVAAAVFG